MDDKTRAKIFALSTNQSKIKAFPRVWVVQLNLLKKKKSSSNCTAEMDQTWRQKSDEKLLVRQLVQYNFHIKEFQNRIFASILTFS